MQSFIDRQIEKQLFPEREMKGSFTLNVEAIEQDVDALLKLENQFVTLYYLSELENNLMDVYAEKQSLSGDDAPELDSEWKSVTGILKGAQTATVGDLPDEVSITDTEGNMLLFKT